MHMEPRQRMARRLDSDQTALDRRGRAFVVAQEMR